jgi:hypothetical protein
VGRNKKMGLFGSKPFKFVESLLLFALLEKRYCNSPVPASLPFSTFATALGPLSDCVFSYLDENAPTSIWIRRLRSALMSSALSPAMTSQHPAPR